MNPDDGPQRQQPRRNGDVLYTVNIKESTS